MVPGLRKFGFPQSLLVEQVDLLHEFKEKNKPMNKTKRKEKKTVSSVYVHVYVHVCVCMQGCQFGTILAPMKLVGPRPRLAVTQ